MATARGFICSSFSTALVFFLATTIPATEPAPTGPGKVQPAAAAGAGNAAPATRSGAVLRDEIRGLLRDVARRPDKPDDAVVRRAVALYHEIQADTQLRASQREPLRVALRNKLARWGEQLAQQPSDRPGKDGAAAAAAPATVERPKPLAQAAGLIGQPGQPTGVGGPPVDHGQELLELIQDTIAPTTWDVHGGNGVVRYWAPGHALIIRQTGDVHEQLGRLLMDMR